MSSPIARFLFVFALAVGWCTAQQTPASAHIVNSSITTNAAPVQAHRTAARAHSVKRAKPAVASVDSKRSPASVQTPSDQILIGSGDLLQVGVNGATDYQYELRVDINGNIALPLVGPVHVAGQSIDQAETTVANKLDRAGEFNHPQVTIFEKEYATQGISVLGEVQKPGIYPLMGTHTLLDAISAAGGTTKEAGQEVTISHRELEAKPEVVKLYYTPDGKPMSTTQLRPGDTVVVSKAGIVYVIGSVHEPTGIVLEHTNITVLQAIAMAHGTLSTARLSGAKLIRHTASGTTMEISIPLNKIIARKSPDLPLIAEDVVFVPGSTAKAVAQRGFQGAIEAATGRAIYRP